MYATRATRGACRRLPAPPTHPIFAPFSSLPLRPPASTRNRLVKLAISMHLSPAAFNVPMRRACISNRYSDNEFSRAQHFRRAAPPPRSRWKRSRFDKSSSIISMSKNAPCRPDGIFHRGFAAFDARRIEAHGLLSRNPKSVLRRIKEPVDIKSRRLPRTAGNFFKLKAPCVRLSATPPKFLFRGF